MAESRDQSRTLRQPNAEHHDIRPPNGEEMFGVERARLMGFVDVYNVFNTHAAQGLTTNSGGPWLRSTAIRGPRIFRIGARLDW